MAKINKEKVPKNAVERLVASLESRIVTYEKNKKRISEEYNGLLAKENRKIADARLQLNALKK